MTLARFPEVPGDSAPYQDLGTYRGANQDFQMEGSYGNKLQNLSILLALKKLVMDLFGSKSEE